MPETYTGTEGNAALAAGMPVMDGNEKWWNGWRRGFPVYPGSRSRT